MNYNDNNYNNTDHTVRNVILAIVAAIAVIIGIWIALCSWAIVSPGNRGVYVTLGSVSNEPLAEGFHLKKPFISRIDEVSVRAQKSSVGANCYSSDLQQINATVAVIYSIPVGNVISIYRDYAGDPFNQFVAPLVQEAFKERTATRSAEMLVKQREAIKQEVLAGLRQKVGGLVTVMDLAIENLDLSDQLERAIEQKMVQEQEAARAKFAQQQAATDAETAVIKANGEAEAITIKGSALRENRDLIQLQIVEKWNGVAPTTVVSGGGDANVLLPIVK